MSQDDAAGLDLIGGELCLDFTNTVGNHNCESPDEHLEDYADLVTWCSHAGIVSSRTAAALLRESERRRGDARRVYARAIALREAMYRILVAVHDRATPHNSDLVVFNSELEAALVHARLQPQSGHLVWTWEPLTFALDQMLWPIVRSAADLLTSDRVERVHECEGDTCGWLFIDTTKNHTRRWCSMGDCGNRAKARRYYHRRRLALATS